MRSHGDDYNPLLDAAPRVWDALIDSVGPPGMLILIEERLSLLLRKRLSPEDIWQEALLQAWRCRAEFEWRGLKSFRNWLVSIIENRIRDAADREAAQKRGGGRPLASLDAVENPRDGDVHHPALSGPIGSTTPSRIAIFREQAAAMRSALERLPEDLREIVRLRLLEQLSAQAVSERLGVDVSTVRRRFRKGAELYERQLRAELASRSTKLSDAERSALASIPLIEDRRVSRP